MSEREIMEIVNNKKKVSGRKEKKRGRCWKRRSGHFIWVFASVLLL